MPPDPVPHHCYTRRRMPLQIKALNKKIRQVDELEAKVAGGGVVPTEEQRQKLARKPALLAELAEVRRLGRESVDNYLGWMNDLRRSIRRR